MKSIKKNRFQKSKRQTIKKRSNRNKKLKRRRTRKRNKIYGGAHTSLQPNSYDFTVLDKGNNLFHLAVINNNANEVKKIIDIIYSKHGYIANFDDDDIINLQNKEGNTPLHLAILNLFNKSRKERRHIYLNIILPILDTKKVNVNLNKIDSQQNTPLHLAIIQYDKDIYNIKDDYEKRDYMHYRFFILRIVKSKFEFTPNIDKNSPLHLLVYMLKNHLEYDMTKSNGNSDLNIKSNSDIREENFKIHELILDFVDILKEKYKEKLFEIFSMKNKAGKTAHSILKSSPIIPTNTLLFPHNYKSLINIDPESVDPESHQNKKTQSVQRNVESNYSYRGLSNKGQTYKLRSQKTEIKPFRQTVLTPK